MVCIHHRHLVALWTGGFVLYPSFSLLERLFRERRYRLNAHAHSTYSDGALTPQEIEERTLEKHHKNFLVAITDHNTVGAHVNFSSPRIVPGVEVKAKEGGVDVLLYTERERLLSFFQDVIEPALDPSDPIYGATRLHVLQLVGIAHEAGLDIVIPHYSHLEGLSVLPVSLQREVVKFPVLIELNGLLSRSANAAAKDFAKSVQRPLIAAADSHRPDQYLSTYTSIPLPRDIPPTGARLFAAVRQHPLRSRLRLRQTGLMSRLVTAWQVLQCVGPLSMLRQYLRGGKQWLSGGGG